ncbi:hypothetical protein J4E93_000491 [Alternaria ventricosa]|uniref:uncharacterized protein n=1 Tax=Alternaria ventricosa TaxID=1187951 RepID=UPI0020C51B8B|nr:uncharacterized protein J4E93_000491 [Alternaria ventricosa]KAI4655776.1 hypothetical protein J4E93_000491 [Alternaria ventricosa]
MVQSEKGFLDTSAADGLLEYPDNDPPGPATAYDCGRNYEAGGTGTYADPLTFASAPGEFEPCEIIWDPYTRKYLRFEDFCAQCDADWNASPRINHIDLWTGSTTVNGGDEQIQCENDLTPGERSQTIVRNPWDGFEPDTTELYVKGASPACRTNHIFPDYNIGNYC